MLYVRIMYRILEKKIKRSYLRTLLTQHPENSRKIFSALRSLVSSPSNQQTKFSFVFNCVQLSFQNVFVFFSKSLLIIYLFKHVELKYVQPIRRYVFLKNMFFFSKIVKNFIFWTTVMMIFPARVIIQNNQI